MLDLAIDYLLPAEPKERKLAKLRSLRGSFRSCPNLPVSNTGTSQPHPQSQSQSQSRSPSIPRPAPLAADIDDSSSQPQSTTDTLDHHYRQQRRLSSVGRRVSVKARGVLGRFQAFPRVAAARMVHPGIKINTNVPSTKRGFPEDDDELADIEGEGEVGVGVDPVTTITGPALDTGDRDNLPPFLCQSNSG